MSGQNTSSAVMQQRRDKAKASLDDFPTPPWATRAGLSLVLKPLLAAHPSQLGKTGRILAPLSATDPCCNRGHMVRPLAEYFGEVRAVDVADYTADPRRAVVGDGTFQQDGIGDYLLPSWESEFRRAAGADIFAMNPPFKLAEAFIEKALRLAKVGVMVFIRSAFPEGQERYETLFSRTPPTAIAYFAERVVLHEGVLRDPDVDYWDWKLNDGKGGWKRPSTATGSIWMVWIKDAERVPNIWIPPCRKALTRPGDYPANPDQRGVFTPPAAEGQEGLL